MSPGNIRGAVLALAACAALAPAPSSAQAVNNPRCPLLFELYESTVRAFGATSNRRDFLAPPPVMNAARSLRMGDCLTFSSALTGMEALGPGAGAAARSRGGAPIAPIHLHVGIVTSTEDDARSRGFFESQGLRARSVGAPMLGRRIYVGPFDSAGALEGARSLALQAGFAYPYPARF